MCDRSFPFIIKLLTLPPLNLPQDEAEELAPTLKNFWANIADGDASLEYPDFPEKVRHHFEKYSAMTPDGYRTFIDNHATLLL